MTSPTAEIVIPSAAMDDRGERRISMRNVKLAL